MDITKKDHLDLITLIIENIINNNATRKIIKNNNFNNSPARKDLLNLPPNFSFIWFLTETSPSVI